MLLPFSNPKDNSQMSGFWDDISTDEQSSSQYDLGGDRQQKVDWPDDRSEVSGFSQLNDESTADDFDVS